MSVQEHLDALRRLVAEARSMPMSASVVVNRSELVALVDALEGSVTRELAAAGDVVARTEELVAEGRRRAEDLVAEARGDQERLASETEVLRTAREQAEQEVADARREADDLRREADDYVDAKLAGFEVTLERTLAAVRRGRQRLAGESELDALRAGDDELRLPEHLED